MADTIRLSSVEGAGNWWKSLTWAKEALTNGGLQVEMSRYGIGASEPLLRVAAGEADLACTLSVAAAQAAKALGLHKNGEATSIRGLAHLIRPNQHYFNMIRADVGIGSLAEIAKKKPKLDMSIGEKEYVSGQIPEVYMRHYGVELFRDIEAWGGSFQTSHPNTIPLIAQGKSNSLMREDTAAGPAGVAAQLPVRFAAARRGYRRPHRTRVLRAEGDDSGWDDPRSERAVPRGHQPGLRTHRQQRSPRRRRLPNGEGVGSIERRGVCSPGRFLQRAPRTEVDRSAPSRSRALLSRARRVEVGG